MYRLIQFRYWLILNRYPAGISVLVWSQFTKTVGENLWLVVEIQLLLAEAVLLCSHCLLLLLSSSSSSFSFSFPSFFPSPLSTYFSTAIKRGKCLFANRCPSLVFGFQTVQCLNSRETHGPHNEAHLLKFKSCKIYATSCMALAK